MMKRSLLLRFLSLVWITATTSTTQAFVAVGPSSRVQTTTTIRTLSPLSATTTTTTAAATVQDAIDATLVAGQNPILLIEQLEALEDSKAEPNRKPEFLGQWHVWWTNCPPPSNGQLGPFTGTSEQMIQDAASGSYQNILRVPPNDWIMAVLDGIYEDWDGTLLDDGSGPQQATAQEDWGARHWKVTFMKLTISVFGFPLVQKEFPPDTARVWRTTFLQGDVRVVRAGKTGRTEDEVIFYTKRQPKP